MSIALLSSCPYPPDDFEASNKRGSVTARPDYLVQPRIRPSAAKIHQMHKGSIGLMFGLDKHQIATGFKSHQSKNHMQLNVQKMREIQNRAKEAQKTERDNIPMPVKPATARYPNVQSKVKEALQEHNSSAPKNANYLKAHSRPASAPVIKKSASEGHLSLNLGLDETDKPNFVKANAKHVSNLTKTAPKSYLDMVAQREKDAERENLIQQRKGKVPKYLNERKIQRQKEFEMEIAKQPDPDMPPGHRKMPEAERVKNLNEFQNTRKELLAELQRLPIAIRSQKAMARKEEIESKLASAEEAIMIFSRPKVFVKIDQ